MTLAHARLLVVTCGLLALLGCGGVRGGRAVRPSSPVVRAEVSVEAPRPPVVYASAPVVYASEPVAQPSAPIEADAAHSAGRYLLVGSDASTEAYHGDTSIDAMLPILCIHPVGLPDPGHLGTPDRTPGGASRRSWSGGELAVTEPLVGRSLRSRAIADQECNTRFGDGWRMAEFHDGRAPGAGWDFWGYAVHGAFEGTRFWVAIDDQQATPWTSSRAMTWTVLRAL